MGTVPAVGAKCSPADITLSRGRGGGAETMQCLDARLVPTAAGLGGGARPLPATFWVAPTLAEAGATVAESTLWALLS